MAKNNQEAEDYTYWFVLQLSYIFLRTVYNVFDINLFVVMSHKENLICELHTKKGTWKIAVRITDMWRLNKQNGRQSIEMVLMDHTVI